MATALLLAVVVALAACDLVASLAFPRPTRTLEVELPIELPYRRGVGNLPIVRGRVNDAVDVDFVLDTGAPVSVVIETLQTRPLAFDMSKARRLGPDDDPAAPIGVLQRNVRFHFGGAALEGLTAVVIAERTLACPERIRDVGFQAVIGADLFSHFVVEVDPGTQRVRLHEPARWQPPTGTTIVPLRFRSGHPYVDAVVRTPSGEALSLDAHLDTGKSGGLTLVAERHSSIAATADAPRTTCFVSGLREVRSGPPVDVSLGGTTFAAVPVTLIEHSATTAVQRGGAIGSGMLGTRRYAIDYPGRRLVVW